MWARVRGRECEIRLVVSRHLTAYNKQYNGDHVKIHASFIKDGKWWVAWSDDVPGALTQGATLESARENFIDAVSMLQKPVDLSKLLG